MSELENNLIQIDDPHTYEVSYLYATLYFDGDLRFNHCNTNFSSQIGLLGRVLYEESREAPMPLEEFLEEVKACALRIAEREETSERQYQR